MQRRGLQGLSSRVLLAVGLLLATMQVGFGQGSSEGNPQDGKRLFERETFGGNGRTCQTCHSARTGTVSPEDAHMRLQLDPDDPLFRHDGSDDGLGNGVTRMLQDATILMVIPLAPNVRLVNAPQARSVIVRRGIPTTLNTPALDAVLMLDGRQPTLQSQAAGAIHDHAQNTVAPTAKELRRLAAFQVTEAFFSSAALRDFARGGSAPGLPAGVTEAEQRGRRFFADLPPGEDGKDGLCATCHSGPMLNATNAFLPVPGVQPGTRFQTVLVSEINAAQNPVIDFIFTNQNRNLCTTLVGPLDLRFKTATPTMTQHAQRTQLIMQQF